MFDRAWSCRRRATGGVGRRGLHAHVCQAGRRSLRTTPPPIAARVAVSDYGDTMLLHCIAQPFQGPPRPMSKSSRPALARSQQSSQKRGWSSGSSMGLPAHAEHSSWSGPEACERALFTAPPSGRASGWAAADRNARSGQECRSGRGQWRFRASGLLVGRCVGKRCCDVWRRSAWSPELTTSMNAFLTLSSVAVAASHSIACSRARLDGGG